MSAGLLNDLIARMSALGLKPSQSQLPNEITLTWDKEDFKKFMLSNVDPNFQRYIDVDIVDNKIVIKLRLL